MSRKPNPRLLQTLFSAVVIIAGTMVAIQYAKGNFRVTKSGFVPESGLLSANSFPPGAEVYVDGKLSSATDDTLYLQPGEYDVEIVKEGFSPWKKHLKLEKELVTQTNAMLFPKAPSLSPLTYTGVENVMPSPDGQKLLYLTASASAQAKKGLYVLELTNNFLSLQRSPQQITEESSLIDIQTSGYIWSPDSTEVLLMGKNRHSILNATKKNDLSTLPDESLESKTLLSKWEEDMYLRERQFLQKFPEEIVAVATQSARNVYLSPDKERIMYTATKEVTLPDSLLPTPPASNTQPEVRNLKTNHVYVYDRKEDKNFLIGQESLEKTPTKRLLATDVFGNSPLTMASSPSAFQTLQATVSAQTALNFATYHTSLYAHDYQWFPDSKHLIYTKGSEIHISEYDGANDTIVYSGPFAGDFVYPWPDGSKLIILTSFSPDTPLNLYAINLK